MNTLPQDRATRQSLTEKHYGATFLLPSGLGARGRRPARLVYVYQPGETILTGLQDALQVIGDNYPTFSFTGSRVLACHAGHQALFFADMVETRKHGPLLMMRQEGQHCPLCAPEYSPYTRIVIRNQGVSDGR